MEPRTVPVSLIVTDGTLTNLQTGVINVNANSGTGGRTITGNLTNNGTVNLNWATSFSTTDGVYVNNGVFNIAAGQTLTISGANQSFLQNAGTLNIDGALNMSSATFEVNGGTVTSSGSFAIASGNFRFDGGSSSGTPFTLTDSSLDIGPGSIGSGQVHDPRCKHLERRCSHRPDIAACRDFNLAAVADCRSRSLPNRGSSMLG